MQSSSIKNTLAGSAISIALLLALFTFALVSSGAKGRAKTMPDDSTGGVVSSLKDTGTESSGSGAPVAITSNHKNLEAVNAVREGKLDTANAAWWGFDTIDATQAIQSSIDSGARTVVVPYLGHDWIVRPLRLAGNQKIILEPGVVIRAKEGQFHGTKDCLFRGQEISSLSIRGYGATLRMRKKDYTSRGYDPSEFRHAIGLFGVSDVKIEGLTVEASGGDGIYLGPTWDERRIPNRNILIKDCHCDDNHRQGISVISAENLVIENCRLGNTRGAAPQAGIDFEPSHPRDLMVGVELRNCVMENNSGSGVIVSLSRQNELSQPVSVRVIDSLIRGSRQPGIRVLARSDRPPKGTVEFVRCTVEDIEYSGLLCDWNAAAELSVRFLGCKWQRVARRNAEAPLHFQIKGAPATGTGGIEFLDCYIFDDRDRPFVRMMPAGDGEIGCAIHGNITVVNPALSPEAELAAAALSKIEIVNKRAHD